MEPKSVLFNENQIIYLLKLFLQVGMILQLLEFVYRISENIIYLVGIVLLHIAFVLFALNYRFQSNSSKISVLFAIFGVLTFVFGSFQENSLVIGFSIVMTLIFMIFSYLFFINDSYEMKLEYYEKEENLLITHNFLFTKITTSFHIPVSSSLKLHSPHFSSVLNSLGHTYYRMHVYETNENIFIAPSLSHGFVVPTKLIQLFQPRSMRIDKITDEVGFNILPTSNLKEINLPIPDLNTQQQVRTEYDKLINNPNFEYSSLDISNKRKFYGFLIIFFELVFLFIVIYFSINFYNLEKSDSFQSYLVISIPVILILIYVLFKTTYELFVQITGKSKITYENDVLHLQYQTKILPPFGFCIHDYFKPQIIIEDHRVYIVIYKDKNIEYFRTPIGYISNNSKN